MSDLKRCLKTLELDKILNFLADETALEDSYSKALEIVPSTDLGEVKRLLLNTSDAYTFMARYATPSFQAVRMLLQV